MVKTKIEWYLSNGKVLKGEEAYNYLTVKEKKFKRLINDNKSIIEQMMKYNTCESLDEDIDKDDIVERIMTTGENLATISVLLDILKEKLEEVLCDDWRL